MQGVAPIVTTILLRDAHRVARLTYLARMVAGVSVVLAFSLFGNVAMLLQGVEYRYVLTDTAGRILDKVPLEQPNKSDEFVVAWTIDKVVKAYTFDFANFRGQFQGAQDSLTHHGWRNFERALLQSGNMNSVRENKFVTTAVPTGPGRILRKDLYMGRYAWKIEFPLLVTYQSSKLRTSQDLLVTVVTARMPEFYNESGLGVRSIIAE